MRLLPLLPCNLPGANLTTRFTPPVGLQCDLQASTKEHFFNVMNIDASVEGLKIHTSSTYREQTTGLHQWMHLKGSNPIISGMHPQ